MFKSIKLSYYKKKEIFTKNNKAYIKSSLKKKFLLLILIKALNVIFISKYCSSKSIVSHLQKEEIRQLNSNENKGPFIKYKSKKDINNALDSDDDINSDEMSRICECNIIKVFPDNQYIHKIVDCLCEGFICSLSDITSGDCVFKFPLIDCDCKVVEVIKENVKSDCKCKRRTFGCSGVEFFNGNCSNIPDNEEYYDAEFIFHILEQIEEGNFTDIFKRVIEENKTFIETQNNIIYQISTVSSQNSTNLSIVSLENCESILKNTYSIDKSEELVLLKLEHYFKNFKIPIIEYQLFTKEGKKLNLTHCNNFELLVSNPVNINESEEFLHNPSSDFYHDKCFTYNSKSKTDITIFDRKKDYNEKNYSLCEKNCNYKEYHYSNKSANCECKTKTIFPKVTVEKFNFEELLNNFVDFKKIFTNIYVVTCTKELFCSKGLKKNSGSYINIVFIACAIILSILFCIKGFNSFKKKINEIIREKFKNNKDMHNETTGTEMNMNVVLKPDLKLDNNQIEKNSDSNTNLYQVNFYNDYEINNLNYSEALDIDKRTFLQIYISFMKINHIVISTFFVHNDYNSTEIKISLFVFWLSLEYVINTLFFNDNTLHKIYEDKGKYNFIYHLPIIIYSIIISFVITKIVTRFANYEDRISKEAKTKSSETETKINNYILSLKCRFVLFFLFMFLFFLIFWYYLSSFCAVFSNTQKKVIINTVIGYANSLLFYPFIVGLIPCSMRFCALKAKNKDKNYLYKASNILGNILFL